MSDRQNTDATLLDTPLWFACRALLEDVADGKIRRFIDVVPHLSAIIDAMRRLMAEFSPLSNVQKARMQKTPLWLACDAMVESLADQEIKDLPDVEPHIDEIIDAVVSAAHAPAL